MKITKRQLKNIIREVIEESNLIQESDSYEYNHRNAEILSNTFEDLGDEGWAFSINWTPGDELFNVVIDKCGNVLEVYSRDDDEDVTDDPRWNQTDWYDVMNRSSVGYGQLNKEDYC